MYAIDDKMLNTLDKFEGYPDLYKRTVVVVKPTNDQEVISAWVFTFHSFHEKLLKETLYDNYVCKNYDLLRSLSGKVAPAERAKLFNELRCV